MHHWFFKKNHMLNDFIHPFDNQVFFSDNWEDDGIVIICIMRITANHLIEEKQLSVNYLGGGPVIRVWDQEICSLCVLRFEPCGCSYDSH